MIRRGVSLAWNRWTWRACSSPLHVDAPGKRKAFELRVGSLIQSVAMNLGFATLLPLILASLPTFVLTRSDVQVMGEMRRMFTAHDIGPNVHLDRMTVDPHLYALGPVAGLQGEVTVVDGQVFVSRAGSDGPVVTVEPKVKSVFLVYAYVPVWNQTAIPENVHNEKDLAEFVETKLAANSRSVFLVRGTARHAQYHVQNYHGSPKDLTHELHDKSKVLYDLHDTPVELVGFFSNREEDGGSFVHMGQKTHIHLISADHKQMGHLESLDLAPGAKLMLP